MTTPDTGSAPAPAADPNADIGADRKAQQLNAERIAQALSALEEDQRDVARALVDQVLDDGRVSAGGAAYVWGILKELGDAERAKMIRDGTVGTLRKVVAEHPDNAVALLDVGLVLVEFGEEEDGIAALESAARLKPDDLRPVLPLISLLLQRQEPERLMAVWQPALAVVEGDNLRAGIAALVRGLGHFGYAEHARQVAEQQRARVTAAADRALLDRLIANLADTGDGPQNLGQLIDEFDRFSAYYDENLQAIGNRGPALIGRMIEQLGWVPDASRDILDAGCGTGLCAPYLRPFARLLHGCDLSVGMLEKSKARNIFDLLTRTDLANAATYPQASFTDVVCADVLVYFGDLSPVLKNFANITRPDGWLILTVEDAGRALPERGWEHRPSGRYSHDPGYVRQALTAAGFSAPKAEIRDTLRFEFRTPVLGYCVAAQRVADADADL